jgi:hypothetical protein
MRIRSVKPEFWDDKITGTMPAKEALFYEGLWCESDDRGVFEWDEAKLRAHLDPYDVKFGGVEGVRSLLEYMRLLGRVFRFEVDGKQYGWVATFRKHQHPQRPTFKYPKPPDPFDEPTEPPPRGVREPSVSPPIRLPESSRTPPSPMVDGGEGRGGDLTTSNDGEQHSPPPLQVLRLPQGGR